MTKKEVQALFKNGNVMTIKEFIECVTCGGFIPYDGYGYYFDENMKSETKEHASFDVDELKRMSKKYKYVVWYNR